MATKGHGHFGHVISSRGPHWYMNVNIYVNMGEENAAKKGVIWSVWSNGHAGKVAPRMVAHYLYLYTYIIFLRIIQ